MNNKKITKIYISMKRKELFTLILIFIILLAFYWIILSNSFTPNKPYIGEV